MPQANDIDMTDNPPDYRDRPAFTAWLQHRLSTVQESELGLGDETRCSGLFGEDKQFSLLSVEAEDTLLVVKLGIFFQEYETGCPCSGEQPVLIDGYCERELEIDTGSGQISRRQDQGLRKRI